LSRSTSAGEARPAATPAGRILLVIGGGITGAGILREATRFGLSALLVEQGDFGSGTSSRSSKLVHGGLRYLKQGKLRLTSASVHERERLVREGPGLVNRLGFLLATYPGDRPGRLLYGTGLLIYDPSGWMSVQIVGHPRPAMAVPESRPATPAAAARDAQLKSAVLDTYYAYFGTWDYDDATSTVTHHIESSLIPGEDGVSYSQEVAFDGGHLVFTNRSQAPGLIPFICWLP
jgi:glycerol-3-phosphate dehydrogenase